MNAYTVGSLWLDDCTADRYRVAAAGQTYQSGEGWIVVEHIDPPNMRTAGPEIELLMIEEARCRFKHRRERDD